MNRQFLEEVSLAEKAPRPAIDIRQRNERALKILVGLMMLLGLFWVYGRWLEGERKLEERTKLEVEYRRELDRERIEHVIRREKLKADLEKSLGAGQADGTR